MLGRNHVAWRSRSSRSVGVPLFVYLIWTVVSVNAADNAAALMARVLTTNAPWLNPPPATGRYSLMWRVDGQTDEILGPFSLANAPTHWDGQPFRVGSIVWTPLHVMAAGTAMYTLGPLGTTNFNGANLATIGVTFSANIRNAVGMGGQGDISYSHSSYPVAVAHFIINPTIAVPIFIETMLSPTNSFQYNVTWHFDPLFLRVGRGLAPRAFDWNEPSSFHERQEFQVVSNTWVFSRGDAWYGNTLGVVPGGHIQTFQLLNLAVGVVMPMIITRSGNTLNLGLRGTDVSGFSLESSDILFGPWSLVQGQLAPNGSSITVTMPTNKPAQYYRLVK